MNDVAIVILSDGATTCGEGLVVTSVDGTNSDY